MEGTSGAVDGTCFREHASKAALEARRGSAFGCDHGVPGDHVLQFEAVTRVGAGRDRARTARESGASYRTVGDQACFRVLVTAGKRQRVSGPYRVGVNPLLRDRTRGWGWSGIRPATTPEPRRSSWSSPQGGGCLPRDGFAHRGKTVESEGSWSCPWFHTTAETDGPHVAWEAPANSRLGPQV